MKRAIVYYTDSMLEEDLDLAVRRQLLKAAGDVPIISVSQKPIDFGHNICVGRKPRSYVSLYEQLLTGLKECNDDTIVFTCEHDVFYNPKYFRFKPPDRENVWFNLNRYFWKRNLDTFGAAVGRRALSQGAAYNNLWLKVVEKQLEDEGAQATTPMMGGYGNWISIYPNVDIRHSGNFTASHGNRRTFEYGEVKGLPKIDYWGTPAEFQEKTGYYDYKVGTLDHLHDKYNPDFSESPVLIPGFRRADLVSLFAELSFDKGAEIGVKCGEHSRMLCEANPDLHLKCVDPWSPGVELPWDEAEARFQMTLKTLNGFNVEIIRKPSTQAATEVPSWSLDFVYIDGAHTFNEVMSDILAWQPRVRPGGIVGGHDYYGDVKLAVDAFVKAHDIELFISDVTEDYPDNTPTWFFARGDL